MKTRSMFLTVMACATFSACAAAGQPHDVLLLRASQIVDRFAVSEAGEWTRTGVFLDGRKAGLAPTCLALGRDGTLYVGERSKGGRILKYSLDGKETGVFAATPFVPKRLCLAPDGKRLFATDGSDVWRFDSATGKGAKSFSGEQWYTEGLAFGPDGLLYVSCLGNGYVEAYDVSGETGVRRRRIECFDVRAPILFAGKDGSKMILPAERTEVIDLVSGRSVLVESTEQLKDVATALRIGKSVYAVDFVAGGIVRLDLESRRADRVGSGAIYASELVDVTATLAGLPKFAKPTRPFKDDIRSPYPDFARMPCWNPESAVFLKGGFGTARLEVLDWDGDGQLDLITASGWADWPWRGNYLYLNPTGKGKRDLDPVFPKAKRLSDGEFAARCPYLGYRTFLGTDGKPLPETHTLEKGANLAYQERQLVDFDGDGLDDLVISVADRVKDEWHDKYDSRGIWTAGHQLHAYVYVAKCVSGKGAGARYARPEIVRLENGDPIEVYGNNPTLVADFDGDGDLDLLILDFRSDITYFENIGTRTKPVYTSGRSLHDAKGNLLMGELCLPAATVADWDGDGHPDVFIGEEDARIGWFRHTGRVENGLPVFEPLRHFRQQADELNFGALNTPCAIDWDGDGDQDILSGNSHGQIAFIENLSGPGVEHPKWAPPVYLTEPDGRPIWLKAGPNGSIQGPCESKWGYSVISVADWDGDGLPDIMANSVRGEIRWWKNVGTRRQPKLGFAQGVEVEWNGAQPPLKWGWIRPETQPNAKWIIAPWRTTPVMHDFNGDGLVDLMLMDGENNLAFYERAKDAKGKLILKAPRKAFLDENGRPLWFPGSWGTVAGGAGRYKFTVCDWDGDGRDDIVYDCHPNAYLLKQVKAADGTWTYRYAGPLARKKLSTHDPAPAVCDFNGDGVPDLLFGAMDGYFYYLRNSRTGTAKSCRRDTSK